MHNNTIATLATTLKTIVALELDIKADTKSLNIHVKNFISQITKTTNEDLQLDENTTNKVRFDVIIKELSFNDKSPISTKILKVVDSILIGGYNFKLQALSLSAMLSALDLTSKTTVNKLDTKLPIKEYKIAYKTMLETAKTNKANKTIKALKANDILLEFNKMDIEDAQSLLKAINQLLVKAD